LQPTGTSTRSRELPEPLEKEKETDMTNLTTDEKLKLARVFANAHSENALLKAALKRLTFAARTSGGVVGRDEELCAVCDEAELLLAKDALTIG
jgi:hypothetical protein